MMATQMVVLVTGANTGLGLEILRALYTSSQPYIIILGSRSLATGEEARAAIEQEKASPFSELETLRIDVTSDHSIDQGVDHIQATYGRLDVLVKNAGASFNGNIRNGRMSMREGWLLS